MTILLKSIGGEQNDRSLDWKKALRMKEAPLSKKIEILEEDGFSIGYIVASCIKHDLYHSIARRELNKRECKIRQVFGDVVFDQMIVTLDKDPRLIVPAARTTLYARYFRSFFLVDGPLDPAWLPLTNPALEVQMFKDLKRMLDTFGLESARLNPAICYLSAVNDKFIETNVWETLTLYHSMRDSALSFLVSRINYLFKNLAVLQDESVDKLSAAETTAITRLVYLNRVQIQNPSQLKACVYIIHNPPPLFFKAFKKSE